MEDKDKDKDKAKAKDKLLDFMAKSCHYVQDHCGDPDAWSEDSMHRENQFQCTSYQMACFLCQNTVKGEQGVEWNVIIDELVDNKKNKNGMMVKSVNKWKKILSKIADELGGWK